MVDDRQDKILETTPISASDLIELKARRQVARPGLVSLLLYHRDGIQTVPLVEGRRVVIGRLPPADVAIRDNSLSRQHACVEMMKGAFWVEDLDSTNGTHINGEAIDRAEVKPGDEIMFGAVSASLHVAGLLDRGRLGTTSHEGFFSELEVEVERARVFGHPLSLLMLRSAKSPEASAGR